MTKDVQGMNCGESRRKDEGPILGKDQETFPMTGIKGKFGKIFFCTNKGGLPTESL
jgi:hypothetical protein